MATNHLQITGMAPLLYAWLAVVSNTLSVNGAGTTAIALPERSVEVSLSPNCTCAQFCNSTCAATNVGSPETVIMYRLTPLNVTELAEKDTGDAAGDLGFLLMTLQKLVTCTPEQANTDECFLAFEPTIRQYFVETNGKYGPFMRCNPLQFPGNTDMMHVDTRSWGCFPWHGHPPTPWVPSSRSTSCPDMQYCPELMNKTVGRDPAMHHAFDPSRPNLATYFGGLWYSVPSQGKCPEGTAPGQSCSWRLQPGKTGKVVNASCMAKRIMVPIELNGKPCYDECPQPLDRTSDCYFGCLDKAVFGSTAHGVTIPPVNKFTVIDLWNKAFASETPSTGGCPNIEDAYAMRDQE
eukprot:m.87625 g.87625  ORF g.87625 m.87625 type:complete len:350 (+) comp19942_c0_seq4:5092-6141(+)